MKNKTRNRGLFNGHCNYARKELYREQCFTNIYDISLKCMLIFHNNLLKIIIARVIIPHIFFYCKCCDFALSYLYE